MNHLRPLIGLSLLLVTPALAQEKRPPRTLAVRVARPTLEAWADPERTRQVGAVQADQVYLRVESSRGMAKVLWDAGGDPTFAWLDQRGLEPLPRRQKFLVVTGLACGPVGAKPGWLVAPMGERDEVRVGPGTNGIVMFAHAGTVMPWSTDRLLLATDAGALKDVRKAGPAGEARQEGLPVLATYPPRSPEAIALFEEAARRAGVPLEWARMEGLHELLDAESDGQVGRLNYTYGRRARRPERWAEVHDELRRGVRSAESSATGLGQLLLDNVDRYYPSGRAGIGDPLEEAVGMLRYIRDRYGDPDRAWARYNSAHEGY